MGTAVREWDAAEAWRKSGEYARAGRVFHRIWKATGQAAAGWRYAHCLRKAGYPEIALKVIRQVIQGSPQLQAARFELLWSLYAARLRPAQEQGRGEAVLAAAREMIEAGAEGLALQLAVFAAIGAARDNGQWGQVSRWCDRLDPSTLSTEPGRHQNRRLPSPRERWYYAKLKALVQLREWGEALEVGERALKEFPRNRDFARWQAEARAGAGDLTGAIAQLEELRGRDQPPWYLLADLASCYLHSGNLDEAWEAGVQAAHLPGEDKAKVGLWEILARVALGRGEPDKAASLVGYTLHLREEHRWRVSEPLRRLRADVEAAAGEPLGETSGPGWKQRVMAALGPAPGPQAPPRSQRFRGAVTTLREGAAFTFLRRPDGERIFVLTRDLPEESRQPGAAVEFSVVSNYDRKKKRQSLRAVDVRPAP